MESFRGTIKSMRESERFWDENWDGNWNISKKYTIGIRIRTGMKYDTTTRKMSWKLGCDLGWRLGWKLNFTWNYIWVRSELRPKGQDNGINKCLEGIYGIWFGDGNCYIRAQMKGG